MRIGISFFSPALKQHGYYMPCCFFISNSGKTDKLRQAGASLLLQKWRAEGFGKRKDHRMPGKHQGINYKAYHFFFCPCTDQLFFLEIDPCFYPKAAWDTPRLLRYTRGLSCHYKDCIIYRDLLFCSLPVPGVMGLPRAVLYPKQQEILRPSGLERYNAFLLRWIDMLLHPTSRRDKVPCQLRNQPYKTSHFCGQLYILLCIIHVWLRSCLRNASGNASAGYGWSCKRQYAFQLQKVCHTYNNHNLSHYHAYTRSAQSRSYVTADLCTL